MNRMKPEEIKDLRKRLGLTAAELAEQLGVIGNTIYQWEMGRRRPSKAAAILLRRLEDERAKREVVPA